MWDKTDLIIGAFIIILIGFFIGFSFAIISDYSWQDAIVEQGYGKYVYDDIKSNKVFKWLTHEEVVNNYWRNRESEKESENESGN